MADGTATISRPIPGIEQEVLVHLIDPNPYQPRSRFLQDDIIRLANSINLLGLQQLPLAREAPEGRFQLIAGERRLRAIKLLQERGEWGETMPVRVCNVDDVTALEMAIAENRDRANISPLDEARAFARLEQLGRTQAQIGERFHMTQSTVSNTMRLLGLPEEVRDLIEEGRISAGHGIAILSLEGSEDRIQFARRVLEEKLSVNSLRELVREHKARIEAENAPSLPGFIPPLSESESQSEDADEPTSEDTTPTTTPDTATAPEQTPATTTVVEEDDADESITPEGDTPDATETPATPESREVPAPPAPPAAPDQSDDDAETSDEPEPASDEAQGDQESVEATPAAPSSTPPLATLPPVLKFGGAPKLRQAALPEELHQWLDENQITVAPALTAFARLSNFAEGEDWTINQLLDALEGRDLPMLETLLSRLSEIAVSTHDRAADPQG